jgi:hypothetical protein
VRHVSAAIHEHADHPAGLAAQCRQQASELLSDQALGRQAPVAESFELANMARLEPVAVAEDLDQMRLVGSGPTAL